MTSDEQTQQLIDFFSQFALQELNRQFGDNGPSMHKLLIKQFKIHYNNYEHMMPDTLAKRHGINSLFVMALDDVMCEVRASFSELKEIVLSIYHAMLQDYLKDEAEKLEHSEDSWSAFVDWVRKGNEANYVNEYFQLNEVEMQEGCLGFDIQKCFYFDFLWEAGKPELCPILCEYDSIFSDFVGNWIQFLRHETIATGGKCCTFRYCKM